jgi:hypothetical protein
MRTTARKRVAAWAARRTPLVMRMAARANKATTSALDGIDFEAAPDWFHHHQNLAWYTNKPILAICAGWQSGKTVFLPYWLRREIHRRGPGDYGAFSSTYALLKKKFLPVLKACFKGLAVFHTGDQQFVFTDAGNRAIHGPTWDGAPTIIQLGHSQNPDSLESATLKGVAWDEPGQRLVPEQSFQTVKSRLMVNRGPMCLTSRPYEPGWFERLVVGGDDDVAVVTFPSWANPVNPAVDDPYWDKVRASMAAWRFVMQYEGRFTMPAGLVYDCFDWELNTCDDFDVSHLLIYPGMDFGSVNTAGMAVADDRSTGTLYVIADYHAAAKRSYPDHVASMRALTKANAGGKAMQPGCGGSKYGEDGWREAYRKHGLGLDEPPENDIDVRIQGAWTQMAARKVVFFRIGAKDTIGDIMHFSYPVDDEGNVIEKRADDTKWHRVAAFGYIMAKLRPSKRIPPPPRTGARPVARQMPGMSRVLPPGPFVAR